MAATEVVDRNSVKMMLNNGTDASGNVKTVGISIGSLGEDETWDANKVIAITDALENCLTKTLVNVQRTRISNLYNE